MSQPDPSSVLSGLTGLTGLTVRSLAEVSLDVFAAAFAAGFSGYQVPIVMTAAQLDARFRAEDGDPFASHVFLADEEPVAVLMIARRGWSSRVAGMGIAPALRGTGLGAALMQRALSDARARGDTRLLLEVIEGNTRAVGLYRRAGFEVVRPLWGFSIASSHSDTSAGTMAVEVDPAVGASLAGRFASPELPWQLQPASLAAMVRPTRSFTNTAASIVAMADATQDTVRLRALAFDPEIDESESVAFTMSLRAMFQGRPWAAPPIFTDAHRSRFFVPGGWATIALRQLEMGHRLASA